MQDTQFIAFKQVEKRIKMKDKKYKIFRFGKISELNYV